MHPVTGTVLTEPNAKSSPSSDQTLTDIIDRRALGAERELVALFAFMPKERQAVERAVDRLSEQLSLQANFRDNSIATEGTVGSADGSNSGGALSPWINEASEEVYALLQLWHRGQTGVIRTIDVNEGNMDSDIAHEGLLAPDDLLSRLCVSGGTDETDQSNLGPDGIYEKYMPSEQAKELWSILLQLKPKILARDRVAAEYSVLSAKQTLSECHAKRSQLLSIRTTAAAHTLLGADSATKKGATSQDEANRSDAGVGELLRQKARLVESFERSVRDEQLCMEGQDMMRLASSAALSSQEFADLKVDGGGPERDGEDRGVNHEVEDDSFVETHDIVDSDDPTDNPFSFDLDTIPASAILEEGSGVRRRSTLRGWKSWQHSRTKSQKRHPHHLLPGLREETHKAAMNRRLVLA